MKWLIIILVIIYICIGIGFVLSLPDEEYKEIEYYDAVVALFWPIILLSIYFSKLFKGRKQ